MRFLRPGPWILLAGGLAAHAGEPVRDGLALWLDAADRATVQCDAAGVVTGWLAPFRFVDGWHTYGLEWGPEYIRFYLDGTLYRSVRNTDWHTPLRMLFDTEIWSWWPAPVPDHFPSTFEVDYVRAWSRADWPEPAGLHIKPMSTAITRLLERE